MTNRPLKTPALHRKSEAARRANQIIRGRTLLMMLVLGIGTFLLLFWKLYDLQINRYDEMQARAVHQQTREVSVNASRGTIYDKNHNILASSTTAEKVIIDPLRIGLYVQNQIKTQDEAAAKALEKGQTYTRQPIRDQSWIARGLSRILDMDQERIEERMSHTTWEYVVLRQKVEKETADEVRKFINGQIDEEGNEIPEGEQRTLTGVYLEPDPKRYYPYNAMAANVLGFVNSEDQGSVGLESKYDGDLSGESGMTVSAKINRINEPLLFQYEQYFDAEDGSDLLLTLDINVQIALEKGIESMLSKFDAAKGGTGIVMDVDSGAILGMASYPNYDSNQPGVLYDEKLKAKLDQQLADIEKDRDRYEAQDAAARAERQELARQTGEEVPEEGLVSSYEKAVTKTKNDTLQSQWRNKCIDSTYEPGSTFKPITLAAALEEGVVNMSSTFYCSGVAHYGGVDMHCHKLTGHGSEDLTGVLENSCNPAMMKIGVELLGAEKMWQYFEDYGLMDKTGVDIGGDVKGIFWQEFGGKDYFTSLIGESSVATASFGQRFNITPLRMITSFASLINGGHLLTPYFVQTITDSEGNVTYEHEVEEVRQVISEDTSEKIRTMLESVVANPEASGKNAYCAGYRIGGKTGTAEKVENPRTSDVVCSFIGFAPADNPQILVLGTFDSPLRQDGGSSTPGGTYIAGGNIAAPTVGPLIAQILDYMGIEKQYANSSELSKADVIVPALTGKTLEEATALLQEQNLTLRAVGDGGAVTAQIPAAGASIPGGSAVAVYLGTEAPTDTVTVPNVVGMSPRAVETALNNQGLYVRATGVSGYTAATSAIDQTIAAGTEVARGTVVEVRFADAQIGDSTVQ